MRVYRDLSRELTESEWKSSGTRKLILEQLAQLANEVNELKEYRSGFYEKDKESAVLKQKLRKATAADMLFDFCLAVGGILVGLVTFLYDKGFLIIGMFLFIVGAVLLGCPVLLRHHQKPDSNLPARSINQTTPPPLTTAGTRGHRGSGSGSGGCRR